MLLIGRSLRTGCLFLANLMASKPHIFLHRGIWHCRDAKRAGWGFGGSPAIAYESWQKWSVIL